MDVPTDCPQRDERLGWTGDAQVFVADGRASTGRRGLLHQVAAHVAATVGDGQCAARYPRLLQPARQPQAGSAAWADAAVIIPWTMYLSYGDRRILETQYPSTVAWVEDMRRRAAR